jgi:pyrroloquinoline quinone (PQQ) biosynthesis protein C
MTKMERLRACFDEVAWAFNTSPPMKRLAEGRFTVDHYKEYLRQLYFYTRESPQMLSLAASHFRGSDREMVRGFLQHAIEEHGHDQWALADLAALGEDVGNLPYRNPLPATLALHAFTFYQITCRNPVAHIGYVYFLEFLPTSSGKGYLQALERLGVPRAAMSFLSDHVIVDEKHNELMAEYADRLIHATI